MKQKMMLVGLCLIMGACGFGKGRQGDDAEVTNLSNLETGDYASSSAESFGDQYSALGKFDTESLPSSLKALPSGSEIGTMNTVYDDEKFTPTYDHEVQPTHSTRLDEARHRVYIMKDTEEENRVVLAIRKGVEEAEIKTLEQAIKVQSAPRQYCSLAHIESMKVDPSRTLFAQDATCNSDGKCAATVNLHVLSVNMDAAASIDINSNPSVPHVCLEVSTHYDVTETKTNRSSPKTAIIQLLSGLGKVLEFSL